MPQRNVDKEYYANALYHVYNRGAGKLDIFTDKADYWAFRRITRRKLKKMAGKIDIQSFSILPNHYHFLIWQENERDMEHFMRSVMTSFGTYYRIRHDWSGRLFETSYKARLLESKEDQSKIQRYILRNHIEAGLLNWLHFGYSI